MRRNRQLRMSRKYERFEVMPRLDQRGSWHISATLRSALGSVGHRLQQLGSKRWIRGGSGRAVGLIWIVDEWVRGRWPARCVTEPNVSGSSYSEGTLILTSRRLDLSSAAPRSDELAVLKAEELTTVKCKRHGLSLNTLMVETPSGKRFVFRTKKMACKQIEARSRMRSLTKR